MLRILLVGYGRMGKMVESLANEYGFNDVDEKSPRPLTIADV